MREYEYKLKTGEIDEIEAAIFAYESRGWKIKDVIFPEDSLPTHIVFTWNRDYPPSYPFVNYP